MERPEICPDCHSKYEKIHGMMYGPGQHVGTSCSNVWHLGADYDPDRWNLSSFDEEFLGEQHISVR